MKTFILSARFLLAVIVLFCLVFQSADAQVKTTTGKKFRPPQLTVELLGSYNLGVQDVRGNVADFFAFKNYGVDAGFGGQLNWKLAVNKKGSVRPYLTLGYAQFHNSDVSTAYIDTNALYFGYPLDSGQYNSTPGRCDLWLRNAYAGLGIEYAFTNADKKGRFIPYVGLDLDLNVLWGLYRQTVDGDTSIHGQTDVGTEISYTIKSTTRFGFGFNIGAQYRLANAFGIAFGTHYRWANLIGKESKKTKTKVEDPNDVNKMELLDKADATLNSMLSKDRNIGYFEFYLGFAFYVGRK